MIREENNSILFTTKVIPNSSKNYIFLKDNEIKIKIKSPPVDGRANKEIIDFLSDYFNIPKRNIEIINGLYNKNKTIKIIGLGKDNFLSCIEKQ